MPELTREEKLKMIEKLPQRLQDFLYSEDTGAFLLYLGQKYNLPDEKIRLLSKLVADVILGIVPITSLAPEISSKIIPEPQTAMNLTQELNNELLAPALAPVPSTPVTPAPAPAPVAPKTTPTQSPPYQGGEKEGVADKYREPIAGPEVVDLRNQPKAGPPRAEAPPAVSKIEPPPPVFTPKPVVPQIKPAIPQAPPAPAPAPAPLIPKPTVPLIEAEPHKIPPPEPKPQYIMRPSGLPPTDLPRNILDLRQDKGEF